MNLSLKKGATLLTLAIGIFSTPLFSQDKFEKEEGVRLEEVPEAAQEFISKLQGVKKFKWYKETSDQGVSYEAKSRNPFYSIEFSKDGLLQDVERRFKWKQLDTELRQSLEAVLSKEFDSFRIKEFQTQWTGDVNLIISSFNSDESLSGITTAFEIVLVGKKDGISRVYEVLISSEFKLLLKRRVIQRQRDNMEL